MLLRLVLAALLSPSAAPADEPWNQWRGASRNGEIAGPVWADSLEALQPSWRVDLGKGYSGPVVSENAVFVVETVDDSTEGARALGRRTGRELWRTTWGGHGKVPFFARRNGDWIRSTPAYDGQSLYVGGMQEVLHRIDAASGEIVWSIDFPRRFATPVPDFGFASSPLVDGGHLYVQAANSIVKVDTESGDTVWRRLVSGGGMSDNGAFSSPVLAELAGRRQLLVQTRYTLYGLDPESGATLWQWDIPSYRGMNILTPTVWGDSILTSSYRNQTHMLTLSGDGEGNLQADESWTYKSHGYMSSPVIIEDHAYLHLGNGRLTCLDLGSGESRWTSQPLGDYWSLVFRGDRILALNELGELLLLRANPEALEILARTEVSRQPTWGHLAVDDGQIFVRELEGLLALDGLSAPPTS